MDGSATTREPFARYYARYLVARKGYKFGVVSEAQELLQYCDYVLTRSNGKTISTIGIVNCEDHSDKVFDMPTEDLARIAVATRKYAQGAQGRATTPNFTICEIGPGTTGKVSRSRIASYRRRAKGKGYSASILAVDTASKKVWPRPGFGGSFSEGGAVEKLLRSPRLSAADLTEPQMATRLGRPIFTFVLLALLTAIFACEQMFGTGKSGDLLAPANATLLNLGGLSYPLIVGAGQWWRLFTAPLLHGDLAHIGFNGFALFLIGRLLEPLIGWRWTAAVFAVSAICGSLMSLAVNPANIIGIGASGGIVGLFAAALTVSSRVPAGMLRMRLISQAIYGLIPALLPFLNAATKGPKIDYGAHFGGALGGVTMGFILVALWPGRLPRPKWANLGTLIAIVFFGIAAAAFMPIRIIHQQQTLLAPNIPSSPAEQNLLAGDLVREYPHDPRLRLAHALVLLRQGKMADAEADLRAGLAERDILENLYDPPIEALVRAVLAADLYEEGNVDEAKTIAKPACLVERIGPYADLMKQRSLCS